MNIESLWFEIALVSFLFAVGNILLGHFEEKTPKWKRIVKFISALVLICLISFYAGRVVALLILAISFVPVTILHLWWLPRNGINGWTAEPKDKYYKLRGWDEKSDKKL